MKTTTLLLTVLGAAAAGLVAGILIAPDKGTETRKKLGKKTEDLKNQVNNLIKTGKDYVQDVAGSVKNEAEGLQQDAENRYNRISSDLG
jgi:gas vesicle protein